jgi:hypothetical protein
LLRHGMLRHDPDSPPAPALLGNGASELPDSSRKGKLAKADEVANEKARSQSESGGPARPPFETAWRPAGFAPLGLPSPQCLTAPQGPRVPGTPEDLESPKRVLLDGVR